MNSYYKLTKPGIVYGNAITAIAGFLLASRYHIQLELLVETVVGIALVIASACVINNCIDQGIDKKMTRTKQRALVSGTVKTPQAIVYGVILGVFGFADLIIYTNWLTVAIGVVGYVDYLVFYSIFKRRSVHGTIIGSVSGAVPIVAGYCAVTNHIDAAVWLLFFTLVVWQMPHFFAIAIGRLKDYTAAELPVLPVKHGLQRTKWQILLYVCAFLVITLLFPVFGYTGYIYLVLMGIADIIWLWYALQGLHTKQDTQWARKMFRFSLIILMLFSLLISFGTRLA